MSAVGHIVRAVVPILVGLAVTLGVKVGYHVNTTEATVVLTSLVTTGYAVLAHAVEHYVPSVGKWLVSLGLFPAS
jgi:hypothetical protein